MSDGETDSGRLCSRQCCSNVSHLGGPQYDAHKAAAVAKVEQYLEGIRVLCPGCVAIVDIGDVCGVEFHRDFCLSRHAK